MAWVKVLSLSWLVPWWFQVSVQSLDGRPADHSNLRCRVIRSLSSVGGLKTRQGSD